jgi:hypothetical protein
VCSKGLWRVQIPHPEGKLRIGKICTIFADRNLYGQEPLTGRNR